ncbi:hypothetical protein VCR15J2_690001 [Vibrio coralliirubri]|nr:hypothetical protein VCR15J2_690001 [Vibrio coralliirubri]
MVKVYLEKCSAGKQKQKRNSLSRSFLTLGNDGVQITKTVIRHPRIE